MRHTATLIRTAVVAAAIVLGASGRADAAGKCTVSATSINFGTYNVFSNNPSDSTATLTYNCSGGTEFVWITLDAGDSGTFNSRTLAHNADRLSYNLFRDAAHSVIWGNGSNGTSMYQDNAPLHKP